MNNEEEGSQTPPAPESESSDQQTPPDPEEGTDEGGSEDRRPRLLPVWVLLGAVALSGGAWAVTEYLGGGPPPDEAQVPLIIASAEPWKVRPDDPGRHGNSQPGHVDLRDADDGRSRGGAGAGYCPRPRSR